MPALTVLFIEDNLDNYELVRFVLVQEGYTVLGAPDGRTGLEMAQTCRADLILLDLSLPEINGWQIARQLKADPATASIPILALTGHTLPGDREKALDAGCDEYISKPLEIPDLLEMVKRFIQK